jgi:hypothetical protein
LHPPKHIHVPPSLPSSSSFPPSFPSNLDIIVELIVNLLKHHSYLFRSPLFFSRHLFLPSLFEPKKKENTKAIDKMHSVLRTSLKTAARGVAVTSVRTYHSISCQDICLSNGGGRNRRSRLRFPIGPVDLGGRGGQVSMRDTFIEIDRAAGQERHDLCFFFLASTKMAMLLL